MTLREFDLYVKNLLPVVDFEKLDSSQNGWQVECGQGSGEHIRKIAFAVDACLQTIEMAQKAGANVLFVHHGLFWGQSVSITGQIYERLKALREADMALYAMHLPLDADPVMGHNAQLAKLLGLQECRPLGKLRANLFIGYSGFLAEEQEWAKIKEVLQRTGFNRKIYWHEWINNNRLIRQVGIISGGGARWWEEAYEKGIDLFLTGETLHQYYHCVKERGFNMVSIGHCYSERWGMIAMAERVEQDCNLPTCFLDIETGL